MSIKQFIFPVFILMILAQWFVPAKVIWDSEKIWRQGNSYKFKTRPIDPYDPFRGKYIVLGFEEETYEVDIDQEWDYSEQVYIALTTDSVGFAKIDRLSRTPINDGSDYLRAEIGNIRRMKKKGIQIIRIDYPFNIFYMEESKAYDAEVFTRRASRDSNQVAYALVNVLNGESVLKEVFINDMPIREFVLQEQERISSEEQE